MSAEDGFDEVAAKDFVFVADGGEVHFLVPALEEGEVGGEFLGEIFGQRRGIRFVKELIQAGGEHGEIVDGEWMMGRAFSP